jgi:hypothetical protein
MSKMKKKGPKGGVKHQPGSGHDRKSRPQKRKRYMKKAARKKQEEETEARRQWEIWDRLSDEQKTFRNDLKPSMPRPENGK